MTDRYTLLCRAAMIAYERAFEYSAPRGSRLDKIAEELLFLKEKASDLFDDFFFGSGRRARREYKWVRKRVEELMEELLGLLGGKLPDWERRLLEYWLGRVREVAAHG